MKLRLAILAAGLAFGASGAIAQTAQPAPANPLQPRVVRPAPAAPAQATPAPAAPAQAAPAKPARQRSAAQLANDDRMRKCGAEWRANKAALTAQGQTWRKFNVDCRARLKAAGQ
ncbi:MAG: hypothetical protein NTZ14_17865 [Hyphomicrobiales bacterium]|nr:hypothetical protein [Hyphomicrobiales bacterium]